MLATYVEDALFAKNVFLYRIDWGRVDAGKIEANGVFVPRPTGVPRILVRLDLRHDVPRYVARAFAAMLTPLRLDFSNAAFDVCCEVDP